MTCLIGHKSVEGDEEVCKVQESVVLLTEEPSANEAAAGLRSGTVRKVALFRIFYR